MSQPTPADAVIAAMAEVHEAAVAFVKLHPKRTTKRLRRAVRAFQELVEDGPTDTGTCRRCHQPIEKRYSRWLHMPGAERGCRAASFTYRWGKEGGWDDSLNRAWVATPEVTK